MKPILIITVIILTVLAGGFSLYQKLSPARNATHSDAGGPTSQAGKVSTIAALSAPAPKLSDTSKDPKIGYSYSARIGPNTEVLLSQKGTTKPSYEIKQDNYSLKFTLDTEAKVIKAEENIIEYAVTISGIPMTLRHTVSANRVKEEFIIDKKPDLKNTSDKLKIPFTMESNGLKSKDDGQGKYTFTDSQGQTVWSIEPPTLINANGKKGEIIASLSHNTYYLLLSTDYLLQATYPVVIDPTVIINTSSAVGATQPSTMRHIVRTSDGTLHAFFNVGTQTATCTVGGSKSGLLWFNSTDSGATWTCQEQLSSSTNPLYYADAKVDTSDNIYVVYSVSANNGANANFDVFYRLLTKGAGSTWTLQTAQTVLDASASIGYAYSVLELEGTTRLWLATRYYDGTNYQISVYYSNGLTAAPTWTQSIANLETPVTDISSHLPMIVRFGSKIGVIYHLRVGANNIRWRFRADTDSLTSWVAEANVPGSAAWADMTESAVGDSAGNIYLATNIGTSITFTYFNGSAWSASSTPFNATGTSGTSVVSVATDGTNVWIVTNDTTDLSSGLSGQRKLVYKKGVPPFTASDFDATATSLVSYHGTFDKYWSFVASVYLDDTTDAGNTTSADTQMVTSSGDIAYFGKTETFDAISWDLSTNGDSGGAITWEYCSAVDGSTACTTWSALTFTSQTSAAASDFEMDGYGAFTAPADWVTAKVNSEATAYYYIRARATASYVTSPVGVQMDAIPNINQVNITSAVAGSAIHAIWTENAVSPTRIRYSSISATASTAPAGTSAISPTIAGYSSATTATTPSTLRHIVRTSDGTLHAFIQGGTQLACGGQTGSNNVGLNWLYSTDLGSTWTCGGQLSSDTTNTMFADARTDSSDNIYVVYSIATTGRNDAYDVFYRLLTKGSGATWTVGSAQTVLDGSGSGTAYGYATLEAEGATRLWLATRYYDGTNYGIIVYYSDGLTAAPTWTQSIATLDTADTTATRHFPALVRFGSNMGIVFTGDSTSDLLFRYRNDADTLTAWVAAATISTSIDPTAATFSAVSDASGKIYVAANDSTATEFSFYNGSSWSALATVSSAAASEFFVSLETDNTGVWVVYGETTGLAGGLSGSRKLVYKKGVSPFATANFDTSSSGIIPYHGIFDKVWTYISSSYTDDTTDAGNTTSADVAMPSASGDIIYFGKTAKYDAISWDLSTLGVGGLVVWEYWNGSTWIALTTYFAVSNNVFITGDGYITFNPHTDWATTTVNGEATAYYYVRARVTTAYSVAPVGVQMAAIPQINWGSVAATPAGVYTIWTENAANSTRIRFANPVTHYVKLQGVKMQGIQVK